MQGMLISCLMISDWPLESEETITDGEYHPKMHQGMKDMRKDWRVPLIISLVNQ